MPTLAGPIRFWLLDGHRRKNFWKIDRPSVSPSALTKGKRVTITTGKYAGQRVRVENDVYQRTVDFPDEFANGYHVMLDTEELVTVRCD